jgi:2-polyprenyl-3-methyl-5-hydroxy-6-metoxy-1,4-benzoquinol methylase
MVIWSGTLLPVDIDKDSIETARLRYHHPQIEFRIGDALTFYHLLFHCEQLFRWKPIEHLPDPRTFVNNIATQLNSGARFIASVPITPSMDANPYHLHDFSRTAFIRMFENAGFRMIDSIVQVQSYQLFSVLEQERSKKQGLRKKFWPIMLLTRPSFFCD